MECELSERFCKDVGMLCRFVVRSVIPKFQAVLNRFFIKAKQFLVQPSRKSPKMNINFSLLNDNSHSDHSDTIIEQIAQEMSHTLMRWLPIFKLKYLEPPASDQCQPCHICIRHHFFCSMDMLVQGRSCTPPAAIVETGYILLVWKGIFIEADLRIKS